MTTHIDNHARTKRQRLAELEQEKAEIERELVDARRSLDRQKARAAEARWAPARGGPAAQRRYARDDRPRDGYGQAAFGPEDFGQDDYDPEDFGAGDFGVGDFGIGDFGGADFSAGDFGASDVGAGDFDADGYDTAEYGQDDYDRAGHDRDDLASADDGSDDLGPAAMAPEGAGSSGYAPHDAATDLVDHGPFYPDDGAFAGAAPSGYAPSIQEVAPAPLGSYATATPRGHVYAPEARTAILVNHGRASAPKRLSRKHKVAAGAVAGLALLVTIVIMALPGPGPSWPPSVARVEGEIARACQNPDVRSEPGQVNFACAKSTRQILWVFSLLTSGNNPNFAEASTGRVGLEPITPSQGGAVATSLNLHHPYQASNPIDSLEVAARAINDIIGGATVTGAYGNAIVQPGLESSSANCLRYTGSAKVTAHKGFPGLCARPVSSTAGQAALVADVFQRWVVGAAPKAAQNASVLYENAKNPGSQQVQAILRHLPNSGR